MTGAQHQQLIEALGKIANQIAVANKIQLFKIRMAPPENSATDYGPDAKYQITILENMAHG